MIIKTKKIIIKSSLRKRNIFVLIIVIECPNGSYGRNCSKTCVIPKYGWLCYETCECKNDEYCDIVSGCLNGKKLRNFKFG